MTQKIVRYEVDETVALNKWVTKLIYSWQQFIYQENYFLCLNVKHKSNNNKLDVPKIN